MVNARPQRAGHAFWRGVTVCVVVATIVATSLGAHQTAPPSAAAQAATQPVPRDTAAIRGRVIAADTREPLRRARVTLSASVLDKPRAMSTDGQGRFEFARLPQGRYTLSASKTVYVTLQFGQRRAVEKGTPIELAAGDTLDLADIALPRGGVIAGRILDDQGDPVAAVAIAAMRPRYVDGARQFVAVGRAVETDDRGEYRLFGLAPGSYYVGTSSTAAGARLPFGPAYYPGTANPSDAERILVRAGQVRSGTDLTIQAVPLSTLLGELGPGPGGAPVADATVRAYSQAGFMSLAGTLRPDGSFSIHNVPPGDYAVVVTSHGQASTGALYGLLPVSVTGGDVGGLYVPMHPGGRVRGRVVFEGARKPPVSPSAFDIVSEVSGLRGLAVGRIGTMRGDWTFEFTNQVGARVLRPGRLPTGWVLESVLLDGRDVTDTPIVFGGTEDITGVSMILSTDVTSLTGRVIGEDGGPVREYGALVFPEDATKWIAPSRFVAAARPDQDGVFKVSGLPPAVYCVVALDTLNEDDATDPAFLELLRDKAVRITLGRGASMDVQVKLLAIGG